MSFAFESIVLNKRRPLTRARARKVSAQKNEKLGFFLFFFAFQRVFLVFFVRIVQLLVEFLLFELLD
jgi:hypothetical protein